MEEQLSGLYMDPNNFIKGTKHCIQTKIYLKLHSEGHFFGGKNVIRLPQDYKKTPQKTTASFIYIKKYSLLY